MEWSHDNWLAQLFTQTSLRMHMLILKVFSRLWMDAYEGNHLAKLKSQSDTIAATRSSGPHLQDVTSGPSRSTCHCNHAGCIVTRIRKFINSIQCGNIRYRTPNQRRTSHYQSLISTTRPIRHVRQGTHLGPWLTPDKIAKCQK